MILVKILLIISYIPLLILYKNALAHFNLLTNDLSQYQIKHKTEFSTHMYISLFFYVLSLLIFIFTQVYNLKLFLSLFSTIFGVILYARFTLIENKTAHYLGVAFWALGVIIWGSYFYTPGILLCLCITLITLSILYKKNYLSTFPMILLIQVSLIIGVLSS